MNTDTTNMAQPTPERVNKPRTSLAKIRVSQHTQNSSLWLPKQPGALITDRWSYTALMIIHVLYALECVSQM